jgi:excisionase family DNA binding protein
MTPSTHLSVVQRPATLTLRELDSSGPLAPQLVDTDRAAALLGVSRSLMKQLLASGEISSRKVGALRRIAVADIDAYVTRGARRAVAGHAVRAPSASTRAATSGGDRSPSRQDPPAAGSRRRCRATPGPTSWTNSAASARRSPPRASLGMPTRRPVVATRWTMPPSAGAGSASGGVAAPCELPTSDDCGGAAPAATESEKKVIEIATAAAVRDHAAKHPGSTPGGLIERANAILAPDEAPLAPDPLVACPAGHRHARRCPRHDLPAPEPLQGPGRDLARTPGHLPRQLLARARSSPSCEARRARWGATSSRGCASRSRGSPASSVSSARPCGSSTSTRQSTP